MKQKAIYLQIEQNIIKSISSNDLRIGDQIMTEEQLCKKYKVSRMTINKAVASLVSKGYIYRVPGKGSFVKSNLVSKKIDHVSSFTQDMVTMGLKPGSKLIEYCIKRGIDLPLVRDKLHLDDNDMIHYFVRLRTGDDSPIALSYTYISGKCIPAIDLNALENSFYEYVAYTLGLRIKTAEGEMTATMPTKEQQKLLHITNEALLLNTHTTYLEDGRAMEYIQTYYIGSKYAYSFVTYTEAANKNGAVWEM